MLNKRIINSLLNRFNKPNDIAIYFYDEKELKVVDNLSFIKNIIIFFEYFKCLKSENIILPGEKNRFCLEAIYASILSKKSFTNLNFQQPEERIKDSLDQFKDFSLFKNIDLKNLIEQKADQYDFEKIKDFLFNFKRSSFFQNPRENKIVYYMFTSGSMGIPKGVSIERNSLNIFMQFIKENLLIEEISSYKYQLSLSPLFFDNFIFDFSYFNESISTIFLLDIHTLLNQLNFSVTDNFNQIIKSINFVYGAPSIIKILISKKFFSFISKAQSKDIFVGLGGEPFSWITASTLLNQLTTFSRINNFYGPTECTCMCSKYDLNKNNFQTEREFHEKYSSLLPIGKIFPYFSFLLKEKKIRLNQINRGELLLGGEAIMNGYLGIKRNPFLEIDNKKFYNTGDIVSTVDGKLFYIHGRKDNQIKIKGNRIEIEEIENRIRSILEIINLIVIDIEDRGILRLILILSIRENDLRFEETITRIDNEWEIISNLRKHLPSVMSISDIFSSNSFPLTPNGKVDRNNIKKIVKKIYNL